MRQTFLKATQWIRKRKNRARLKLTAKLNLILEIENSVMSRFILGTSTHPPKIFLQTKIFGETLL